LKHLFEYEKFNLQSKLYEGAIQLTPSERDQIEKMIPKIIDVIEGKEIKSSADNKVVVDIIDFLSADGKTPGFLSVYVGNDAPKLLAYHQKNDSKDLGDNELVIQQNNFTGKFFNFLWKTISKFHGDKNAGIEFLRTTLKHELIHAKDPAENQHIPKNPEKYSYDPEVYYKSWAEFQTYTGELFELIISGVDRIMKSNPSDADIKKIEIALDDLLNYYSKEEKSRKIERGTIDFIQDNESRNDFQKAFKFLSDFVGISDRNPLSRSLDDISKIKKYHPEAYNEFLKDLYKTIDQCKNVINKDKKISLNSRISSRQTPQKY
jgi:hypothetical protein